MGYPRWEDVKIKAKNEASGDFYIFFVQRSDSIADILKKIEDRFMVSRGQYKASYQDDEKCKVLLETEDDLHCVFNRRQPRGGKEGVDYGEKPIYFARIFIEPKKTSSHGEFEPI